MRSTLKLQDDPLRMLTVIEASAVVLAFAFDSGLCAIVTPYLPLLHPAAVAFSAACALICAAATFSLSHRAPARKRTIAIAAVALLAASIEPPYGITPIILAGVFAARLSFAYGFTGVFVAWVSATIAVVARFTFHSGGVGGQAIPLTVEIYEVGTLAVLLGLIYGTVAIAAAYAKRAAQAGAAEERARIALDMHDALGHRLTALAVQLQNAQQLRVRDAARADGYLSLAMHTSTGLLQDVREAVGVLRDASETPEPFRMRIERLLRDFSESNPALTWRLDLPRELKADVAITLYRVVQESLTNVARHARASRVEVEITCTSDAVTATVRDDGCGFQVPRAGNGLASMRERLDAVGGTLRVESTTGAGTCVVAWVPLT